MDGITDEYHSCDFNIWRWKTSGSEVLQVWYDVYKEMLNYDPQANI